MRYLPLYLWISGFSITEPTYLIAYLKLPSEATTQLLLINKHGFVNWSNRSYFGIAFALMRYSLTHTQTKMNPMLHLLQLCILMNDLFLVAFLLYLSTMYYLNITIIICISQFDITISFNINYINIKVCLLFIFLRNDKIYILFNKRY